MSHEENCLNLGCVRCNDSMEQQTTRQNPSIQQLFTTWQFPGGLTLTHGSRADDQCVIKQAEERPIITDRMTSAKLIREYRKQIRTIAEGRR